jgi:hypothetical protein
LEIKEKFDIPFVSLFYDGDIDVNDKVASLLKTLTIDKKEESTRRAIYCRRSPLLNAKR